MEPFRDNDLVAGLAALRPAARPAFAAELDERAAAGFPRRSSLGASPLSGLRARLRALPPRRLAFSAGAVALAAVAAATVVVAIGEPGTDSNLSSGYGDGVRLSERPNAAAGEESSGFLSKVSPLDSEAAPAAKAAPSAGGSSGVEQSNFNGSANYNSSFRLDRDIERSAEMVLGADAADVSKDASRVFEAVHAHRGIVLRSSIHDGDEGEAGASFELLIPSARLGDALAAFSGIAEVRSRHEATADITAPTVRTGELLRDSRAKIDSLLNQLSAAETDAERTAAEAKLRAERRHGAYLRSQLSSLQRRANLSRVSLRIESGAGPTAPGAESGWGVGDALGDAGHILAIAAAVTIVGLAILAPLVLIALLAWLVNRTRIRRGRERALE